jgi:putative endonuclease
MNSKTYYVYILTNQSNRVLYVGVTNSIERRLYEHKTKLNKGFTAKYNLNKLVYIEETDDVGWAIGREKQIKGGSRLDKIDLINKENPLWDDLAKDWL